MTPMEKWKRRLMDLYQHLPDVAEVRELELRHLLREAREETLALLEEEPTRGPFQNGGVHVQGNRGMVVIRFIVPREEV